MKNEIVLFTDGDVNIEVQINLEKFELHVNGYD